MNLKPFFCYYGGKFRAAPHYPKPLYATVVEPFAGAAGYSTRYHDRKVILVEKDPIIAALWKYLIRVPASEIRSLPLIGNDQTTDDLRGVLPPEAVSLIGFWLNKGTTSPQRKPSSWMRQGTHPNSYWGAVIRERIAGQVDQIRHWRCVEGSYAEISNPTKPATWYVDPPYKGQGKYYRCSSASIDFGHLATWCRSLPGQTLVCEQSGADWLPFSTLGSFKANVSANGKKYCDEVLWENHTVPELHAGAANGS